MKSPISRYLLVGLLLLITGIVHAEGVCPPGMFPTNPPGAQGPVGCAPIPGYNNNQQQVQPRLPPPQWESRWGAIATDFAHSSAGASVDQLDRNSAEEAALANCRSNGGSECKVEITYYDQCAALVVGTTGHNSGSAPTIDDSGQNGHKNVHRCR